MTDVICPRCGGPGANSACILCSGGLVNEEVAAAYRITPLWPDSERTSASSKYDTVGKLVAAASIAGGATEKNVRLFLLNLNIDFDQALTAGPPNPNITYTTTYPGTT